MDTSHPKYNKDFLPLRTNPSGAEDRYEYFTASDGARLFVQYWLPPSGAPDRVVLCLHGMSAHGWYYVLMADDFVRHNMAVYCPDYRYHGLSDGPRGDMPDRDRMRADVKEFALELKRRYPHAKLYVIGESMGGCINVNLQLDAPGLASGMVLIVPAIKPAMKFRFADVIKLPLMLLAAIFAPGWRFIPATGDEARSMRSPANIKYDRDDPLHLKKISVRYILNVTKMMKRGATLGPVAIKIPSLIIQGGKDVAVSPEASRKFYERLAAPDKTFKFYPDGLHCMQTDPTITDLRPTVTLWILAH